MRTLFLLTINLLFFVFGYAQRYDQAKINKQARTIYDLSLQRAEDGKYYEAIQMLDKAISLDGKFVDAYLSRAGLYGQLRNHAKAVSDYENAFRLDSTYAHDYKLPYSINMAGTGNFENALKAVDDFLLDKSLGEKSKKAADYRRKSYEFAIDYAKTHPAKNYVFAPKNLGDSVNTKYPEYFPTMAIDGKQLIFTRQVNFFNEDFLSIFLVDLPVTAVLDLPVTGVSASSFTFIPTDPSAETEGVTFKVRL
jgi:tetratricopeptide (TPR) repeat protein